MSGLTVGAVAVHAATGPDQLRAKRAQLVAQLAAIQPGRNSANSALMAAENAYNQAQAQLNVTRADLDLQNAQLASLSRAIADDQAAAGSAKRALAALTRATYESAASNSMMTAVLNARDFSAAMNSIQGASHVTGQIQDLENTLNRRQADLQAKRKLLQADFAKASSLESQLSDDGNRLMAVVAQRNIAASSLNGPARQLASQIAAVDIQLNGGGSAGGGGSSGGPFVPPPGGGSCGNRFAFGQCTYYVASRRCIPWGGNADQWFYNAAAAGFSEGHSPMPGAVVVWWAGRGGASSVGHVGYVEAVGPSAGIPAGSFKLSEMNWNGWDQVDYRVVTNDPGVFQGFIYGHA
jgi:peptidoglycan DL-endopeptidase CwlO